MNSKTRRVRFAPSPTGRLHVGGARTALFNWLFARHHGGTMILRIEDTDLERSTRAAETALLADLRWLGLDWDEGPDRGGPHPPYRQSDRLEIYAKQAEVLVTDGLAFPCFCSDEDLERKREAQLAAGEEPRYDGTCHDLSAAEVVRRRTAGEKHTIRFRVPATTVRFDDHVRGDMQFDSQVVGDFVLVRSNGLPTYNFACVVDDSAMEITHVIRGEDHLANTMRQVLLYQALRLPLPEFAHLSLILGEDRAKLKKREGREGTYVDEYRAQGWLPAALVNFLALLGWSPSSGEELMSNGRLREQFDLDRISRSPAIFDTKKLRWMGGEYLRAAPVADLAVAALPFLEAAGIPADRAQAEKWVVAFRDGLACLAELPPAVAALLEPAAAEPDAAASLRAPEAQRLLSLVATRLADRMQAGDATDGMAFKTLLAACGKEVGVKGRELFMPARAALTGRAHGPELPLLFDALGADRALDRIRAAAAVHS